MDFLQSSSTVSPPSSNTMRGAQSFEKKVEEMRPSKRYAHFVSFEGWNTRRPTLEFIAAMMMYNKLGISPNITVEKQYNLTI